ncbi:serine/threonine-protein kinase [Nonomuraea typhae]|uniref:Serine/threonine-protein kinase n=1 Tax=Nonomuraea typhae TaxID=2603600 RepID=A0ABW7Z1S7_9ACTN
MTVQPLRSGDPPAVGPYRLAGRLGVGGQGTVYLAYDAAGSQVAVKVPHRGRGEAGRRRLRHEFEVLRRVSGFCTARLLDADMTGGLPYLVTEYVAGPSLFALIRESGPRGGTELERLAIATATALAAIHRAGIVHGDVKPQNILLGADGPRIIDFSVAHDAATVTGGSAPVGTPAFMAPEQLSGGGAGVAADVFAWGATMVYAATGAYPFGGGASAEVLYRVLHTEPDLGALEGALRTLVASCLAKDPARRPSAQDLVHHIMDQGRDDSPTLAVPRQGGGFPAPVQAARRARPYLVAAAVAVLVVAGVLAWLLRPGGEPPAVVRPPAYAEEARRQAETAFETVHGFDYRTLDADYKRVRENVYGRAGQELAAQLVKDAPWIRKNKAVRTGVPGGSGIVVASADRVAVLVYGEVTLTTGGKNPQHAFRPQVMEMLLVGDVWRLEHIWPRAPEPDSVEQAEGEWPADSARAMMSAAGAARAVGFDESSDATRATLLALGTDGTLTRLTVVRTGTAFTVESRKNLTPG